MYTENDHSNIENYSDLKKLQQVLLEILEVVDSFCKKNKIGYSLCGGCMIGAIRHGGFIPWDDDVDIIMKRNDYNRFIELWIQNPPDGYILQNKDFGTDDIDISFTKIRKEHTTFLQFEKQRNKYHVGIFIDIFPFDRMPSGIWKKYLFYWRCMRYQLYIREYIPSNSNIIIRALSSILLAFSNKERNKKKCRKLLEKITLYNNDDTLPLVAIETIKSMRIEYSHDLMDNLVPIKFEDKEFLCFEKWDEYLKKFYGNYMSLPPKEEQNWAHHPIIIDFENDLEELEKNKLSVE